MLAAPTTSSTEEGSEGLVGAGGDKGCTCHGGKGAGGEVTEEGGAGETQAKAVAMASTSEDMRMKNLSAFVLGEPRAAPAMAASGGGHEGRGELGFFRKIDMGCRSNWTLEVMGEDFSHSHP